MAGPTTANLVRPRYTVIVQWSDEDQVYVGVGELIFEMHFIEKASENSEAFFV